MDTVREFFAALQTERGASPHTLAAYRRDLARYREFLASRRIDAADAASEEDVAAFVAHLSMATHDDGRAYRTSSIARALAAVRSLHRFLVREEDATEDLISGLPSSRWRERDKEREN